MAIARAYIVVLLLAGAFLAPMPLGIFAAALLLLNLWLLLRNPGRRAGLIIGLVNVFSLPLLGQQALTSFISSGTGAEFLGLSLEPPSLIAWVLGLPVLYSLVLELKKGPAPQPGNAGRAFTGEALFLMLAAPILLAAALVLGNAILALTAMATLLFATFGLARAAYQLRGIPLNVDPLRLKAVSGEQASARLAVKNGRGLPASLKAAESWVTIEPAELKPRETRVDISLTPPLSGPAKPGINVGVSDSWGLMMLRYTLNPLELEVIPRARYARFLAEKFLAGGGEGGLPGVESQLLSALRKTRGLEYLNSREYRPGDRLKDIDFKHSLKFGRMITKDYSQASGSMCLLVAGLTAGSPEEADEIGYNAIAAALTMAREGIPTALAIYNQRGVMAITKPGNPKDALRRVLSLAGGIEIIEGVKRRLAPPAIPQLKGNIRTMEKAAPASRLLEILRFQYDALRASAEGSPLALAVNEATRAVKPPASVVITLKPDLEAGVMAVVLSELRENGYSVIDLSSLLRPLT